jgi:hypothetical protein
MEAPVIRDEGLQFYMLLDLSSVVVFARGDDQREDRTRKRCERDKTSLPLIMNDAMKDKQFIRTSIRKI